MPIKLTCPHCKRAMLVDERLAGKSGRCKACQQPITVPSLPNTNSTAKEAPKAKAPPAGKPAAPAKPVDVEAEAAALFADEPQRAETVEVKTIEMNCPFCDEHVHFPADLAGKRAPCPECKHIVKVPELEKKDPKDWRKVEARGPAGARQAEQPELEGAWSSATVGRVGQKTLEEVGLIPKFEKPLTLWQRYRLLVLVGSLLLVLTVAGLLGYQWMGLRSVERGIREAIAFADSPEAQPTDKAALSLVAGEYYLNSPAGHPDPRTGKSDLPAEGANKQFGIAFSTLHSMSPGPERDALFIDLASAQVELGGDKAEVNEGRRLAWDEVQKRLVATLGQIADAEARLMALRTILPLLRAHGQASRALTLTNQVYPTADADKAAALSIVGIDSLRADDRASAERAADMALAAPPKGAKPQPLRSQVVALAVLLDKKYPPPPEDKDEDKVNELIGRVEALARQDKWDDARKHASLKQLDAQARFRALVAIAAAAADAKAPDNTDMEAALKAGEALGGKEELSWPLYRLTRLALRSGVPEDRVQAMADKIGNAALRGRAQLAIFRSRLDLAKEAVDTSSADKIEAQTAARSLAAHAVARHNTRLDPNYASVVQTWQQPLKSFGLVGIARGIQDRTK